MLHENRSRAESFGGEAELYHRVRPRYPAELIDHLVGDGAPRVLDVGCGTGIAAALLARRGCTVLGVEVDARMADVARDHRIEVEVSPFEDWEARGRTFDLVTAGQAWHWVAPERGFPKAADVLAPDGRIALFWNYARLDEPLRATLQGIYDRMAPELGEPTMTLGGAMTVLTKVAGDVKAAPDFSDPEIHDWTWATTYTTAQWVEIAQTQSNHRSLPDERRAALLGEVAATLDGLGGEVPVHYDTRLVQARRQ